MRQEAEAERLRQEAARLEAERAKTAGVPLPSGAGVKPAAATSAKVFPFFFFLHVGDVELRSKSNGHSGNFRHRTSHYRPSSPARIEGTVRSIGCRSKGASLFFSSLPILFMECLFYNLQANFFCSH